MPRATNAPASKKRKQRLLKRAKGFRWSRKNKYRLAKEALLHALTYAYRDRKAKKRVFRRLWQLRINAGARQHGLSYSKFMHLLRENGIQLNRKVLSELAVEYPEVFEKVVEKIKKTN